LYLITHYFLLSLVSYLLTLNLIAHLSHSSLEVLLSIISPSALELRGSMSFVLDMLSPNYPMLWLLFAEVSPVGSVPMMKL
jgi:hypothetical protein